MQTNLTEVQQRVRRYWYTDGIGELIGGAMFILLGLYFALQAWLGDGSLLSGFLQASLALLIIGSMFLGRRLINSLKARLTYPRTGYVEYRVDQRAVRWKRILGMSLGFAVAALAVSLTRVSQSFDSTVAVTGLLVAVILIIIQARSSGLGRFYLLAAISLVLGLVLSLSGWPQGYSLGLFYGLMGACYMISGGLTLKRYLQQNPLPADAERQNG